MAEGVGGLPFALFRSVVAEEEGIAKLTNQRLAGKESVRVITLAEGGHPDRLIGTLILHSQRIAQKVVEKHLVSGEHRVAAGYRRFIQNVRAVTMD